MGFELWVDVLDSLGPYNFMQAMSTFIQIEKGQDSMSLAKLKNIIHGFKNTCLWLLLPLFSCLLPPLYIKETLASFKTHEIQPEKDL